MLDIIDGFFEMVFGDLIDICIEIGSLIYKSLMIMLLAGGVLAIVYIIYILAEDPINAAIDKRKHISRRSKHKKHKKKKKKKWRGSHEEGSFTA